MSRRLLGVLPASAIIAVLGCSPAQEASRLAEVQRVRAGDLDVVVLSDAGTLNQGKDAFVIEFRSRSDQRLVDVGAVKVAATMVMAGMPPMIGNTTVMRTGTPGRYDVTTELGMAGTWRLGLEWDGPAGHGSTSFQGKVQ
jgi:hypothetical protein